MKKFSSLILGSLLLTTAVSLVSCDDELIGQSQMQEYIQKKYYDDIPTEKIKSVVIDKRNTNDKEETDEIWCTVISNDGRCEYKRMFYLEARLYNDSGWKLKEFESVEKDKWEQIPVSGVNISDIKKSIYNTYIKVGEYDWCITEENLRDISLKSQDTDLKKRKDTVDVLLLLSTDIMTADVPVNMTFSYDGGWSLDEFVQSEDVSPSYISECEFNVSEDEMIGTISEHQLEVGGTIEKQYVTIEKKYLKNFEISDQESWFNGYHNTVRCDFTVDKNNVMIDVKAELNYEFNKDEKQWEFTYLTYNPEIVSIDLKGQWEGTYYASQGITALNLDITSQDEKNIGGIFNFSATTDNPGVPSGSYETAGTLYSESLTFYLGGTKWIEQPVDYEFIDLYGIYMIDEGCIKQNSGRSFTLQKSSKNIIDNEVSE